MHPRSTDEGWDRQPLIGFFTSIRAAVRRASAGQSAGAYLIQWPRLEFEAVGIDRLSVRLGRAESAIAPAREFISAVEQFGRAVEAWLSEAAPDLRRHPGWEGWFPEDPVLDD